MNLKELKGNLLLISAALIWGLAFVVQDKAAGLIDPFTINALRSVVGSVILLPVIYVKQKKNGNSFFETDKKRKKDLITAGILCGIFLCISVNFQQFGIGFYPDNASASGRSGFITALYVVLVPVFGLFLKKKIRLNTWISVGLATFGMYLLCFSSGSSGIYLGDVIVLCCAVFFSLQIIMIDKYADLVDGVKLSSIQFLVCGILSFILMFIFEKPEIKNILFCLWHILYLGIFSSGVGYTFQIIGQQYSKNPTLASIIMSLESVFAAIGGALILNERFTPREMIGCIIMFSAIILAQLPSKETTK